jgi:hypothetical protein
MMMSLGSNEEDPGRWAVPGSLLAENPSGGNFVNFPLTLMP